MKKISKLEILARIDELKRIDKDISPSEKHVRLRSKIESRINTLSRQIDGSKEDLLGSIVQSHKILCAVKKMNEDAAYGQDPSMFYTLAICGEAGEMANKIVKALRNGDNPKKVRRAVISELPDVYIYGGVLAHVLNLDIEELVNEKAKIVIERANNGYYGGPIKKKPSPRKKQSGR